MAVTGKGILGWRGPKGLSAYDIALQNGFVGTEKEWLSTLGTSSHFTEDKTTYYTNDRNESILQLPDSYLNKDFSTLNLYINGMRILAQDYTINETARTITLSNPIVEIGTEVEMVVLTITTNDLPIMSTISAGSTNDTAPGTKAVYDFVTGEIKKVPSQIIDDTTASTSKVYSGNKVNSLLNGKLDTSNIQTLTGTVSNIGAGATSITDIEYPAGFTKDNTLIIGKMVSSNNNYYDMTDLESTANGFPTIKQVALTDETIRLWLQNTSSDTARIGYYKLVIMKIGG
jgi:hypothetical protein